MLDDTFGPDDDLFLDVDMAEDIEPKVWMLTIYPEPDEPWRGAENDIRNALLGVYEIRNVELKRIS